MQEIMKMVGKEFFMSLREFCVAVIPCSGTKKFYISLIKQPEGDAHAAKATSCRLRLYRHPCL